MEKLRYLSKRACREEASSRPLQEKEHVLKTTPQQVPDTLHLTPAVLTQIKETIGSRKAETGGILGGNRTTGEVTHFCFDEVPQERSGVAYTPNIAALNSVIKGEWKPQGIEFLGSVHSHP